MTLADLLGPRRVVVPLPATTLEEGLRVLVDACVADGRVADAIRLDEAIRESWPEDTMSLGPHAWLPHFRTDAVRGLVVALGIAEAPIAPGGREPGAREGAAREGGHRGAEPRMILLIVASPRDTASYLQTVAAFARVLARDEVAQALLAARSPAQVLGLPALREQELEGPLLVRDVMRAEIVALRPEDSLDAAARTLERLAADALPVVAEGGQVVGMLSYRELLRQLAPGYVQRVTGSAPGSPPDARALLVRDAMARRVFCVSEDQTVADAAHLLTSRDVERVPVVAEGVLRGFLTRADLVHRLLGSR